MEYESNADINKTLLIKEYLDEIKPCLKDIINKQHRKWQWKLILLLVNIQNHL